MSDHDLLLKGLRRNINVDYMTVAEFDAWLEDHDALLRDQIAKDIRANISRLDMRLDAFEHGYDAGQEKAATIAEGL